MNKQIKKTRTTASLATTMVSTAIATALATVMASGLSACGQAEWREVSAPNTGDAAAELITGDLNVHAIQSGQTAYVAPERLRVRETTEQSPETATAVLDRGDQVAIVDPTPVGQEQLVAVRPVTPTATETRPAYVPVRYLQTQPASASEADRYIMIQNIATEKLRVYERATTAGAPHKLILETDMIAGENNPSKTRRTMLGSYKIESWHKFYQDNQKLFPSWHDPKLPSLPLPGSSLADWTQPHFLPVVNGKPSGVVRGAFGWYTAKIGPNANAQWTHGTLGWGADGDRFIQISKSQLAQYYSDPRSFGCTRVENQAIAYLHDLLPVGTRVIKVYARESLADAQLARYQEAQSKEWEWLLSKDEVRKVSPNSSSKPAQIMRHVPSESVIEQGTYRINAKPSAVQFKKHVKGIKLEATIIRAEANLYDIPESSFQGVFLVDEGRFVDYKHPRDLRVGGYSDKLLPNLLLK